MKKIGLVTNSNSLSWIVESYSAAGIDVRAAVALDGVWPDSVGCAQAESVTALKTEYGVDIVHLVASPQDQSDLALELFAVGCDVVLTLPTVCQPTQVKRLLEAAAANQADLYWFAPQRFDPAYRSAKEKLESGALGPAAVVRLEHTQSSNFSNVRTLPAAASVAEALVCDLDYLHWCFGPIQRIFVRGTADLDPSHPKQILAVARMAQGPIVHIQAGFTSDAGEDRWALEISCRDGMIVHDSSSSQGLFVQGPAAERPLAGPFSWLLHQNAIGRFGRDLLSGLAPTGEELLQLSYLVEGALVSLRSKQLTVFDQEVSG